MINLFKRVEFMGGVSYTAGGFALLERNGEYVVSMGGDYLVSKTRDTIDQKEWNEMPDNQKEQYVFETLDSAARFVLEYLNDFYGKLDAFSRQKDSKK